jgi:outer membrane protein assembly factor BamB
VWAAALAVAALPELIRADDLPAVGLPGESRATALKLGQAQKSIAEGKWAEGLEHLQGVLDSGGNDLVSVDGRRSVQARRLVHLALAGLPAEALRLYRGRVESRAARWLEQAASARDVDLLRKIVEEAFASRAAEKALDLLGDLAFERGRFDEAAAWWRVLAPLRKEEGALVYPDLTLSGARIAAKQLLARLFGEGPSGNFTQELRAYRAAFGNAEGTLAGRRGRYADLLEAIAAGQRDEPPADPDWAGYGGNDSRGLVPAAPADVLDHLSALCRDGPTWRFSLESRTRQEGPTPLPDRSVPLSTMARSLAFHPVLTPTHALVADAQHVTAHDLRTGESADWLALAPAEAGSKVNLRLPAPPDLRYTLSLAQGSVYARLGVQGLRPPELIDAANPRRARPAHPDDSFVVRLAPPTPDSKAHLCWRNRPAGRDGAIFEGSPVVDGGQVYIAATRFVEQKAITSIQCFSDGRAEASLAWSREICETRVLPGSRAEPEGVRYRHNLLTRAGSLLVYCSHTGAIVAVDAATGQIVWGIRYPRQADENDEDTLELADSVRPNGGWRDLTPCLFAGGLLYAAPADSNCLLCLDPATGKTLWERDHLQVVHLLGVGHGKLIFTTAGGLRALGAADGAAGWSLPDDGWLAPMGRGLLLGDLVLWPTAQLHRETGASHFVVVAVRQEDGRPAADPPALERLPAGNLAYAHGCLAVADQHTLSVFVPPRLRLGEKERQAREVPAGPITQQSARTLLELAHAQLDAGQPAAALTTLARIETAGNQTSRLRQQAGRLRQEAWLTTARQAAQRRKWDEAETALNEAAGMGLSPPFRLYALVRGAELWEQAGQNRRAAAAWDGIRANSSLRQVAVVTKAGLPSLAGDAAAAEARRLGGAQEPPTRAAPPAAANPPSAQDWPLRRLWHVSLRTSESPLSGPEGMQGDLFLVGTQTGEVTALTGKTGSGAWRCPVGFTPSWGVCKGDHVIVGGSGGVTCRLRQEGQRVWDFPAPPTDRYPAALPLTFRPVLDPRPPEPLTEFDLAEDRLFFAQGKRLFALNAKTGQALWVQPISDRPLRERGPLFCAGATTVLLQSPTGRRFLLDGASGKRIHQTPPTFGPPSTRPLILNGCFLIPATDPPRVIALDEQTGRQRWSHLLGGKTTLTGGAPLLVAGNGCLLALTPTNLGCQVERLDPASGRFLWPRPLALPLGDLERGGWAVDSESFYLAAPLATDGPAAALLQCRSLADGRLVWERPLRGAAWWSVRRVGEGLVCYPSSGPAAQFRFAWPWGALQWEQDQPLAPGEGYPVVCCDARTGATVQHLSFACTPRLRWERPAWGSLNLGVCRTQTGMPAFRPWERGAVLALVSDIWGLSGD